MRITKHLSILLAGLALAASAFADPLSALTEKEAGGGLKAAMGYVGGATLKEFQERATFVRISGAGLRESHAHDVTITRESPNYPGAGA